MERHFDAFLYLANWGTHKLMLRVPKGSFDLRTARRYCRSDSATVRANGEFVMLEFCSDNEEGEWTDDGSGWLSSLIPLRRDLGSGDHRTLYLAWLDGRGPDTRVRIQALRERHAAKPSFLGRLRKSGLVKT